MVDLKDGNDAITKETHIHPESKNITETSNPYLDMFLKFQEKSPDISTSIFDPRLDENTREELFNMVDSDIAEEYSWAIPDERALKIIKHYGPIVEMGGGRGYWARLLEARGVDIVCYDLHLPSGNDDNDDDASSLDGDCEPIRNWFPVKQGTPKKLQAHSDRALMLCYPDDFEEDDESMGLKCLENYSGNTVIYIGETFGNSFCLPSPWGRTAAPEFLERLASIYHKILQVPLPSWHSSMDTLSVWRRSETCIVDNNIYAHIPLSERLTLLEYCPDTEHLVHASTNKQNKRRKESVDM